jgi:hypothetical protein
VAERPKQLASYLGSLNHPEGRLGYLGKHGRFVASGSADFDPGPTDPVYRFNSLGFRGGEFDERAAFKLFVFGCSYTFGMGLRHDLTWPYLLKRALADRLSLPRSQVNLQNFSQLGASNSFIARTVLDQCARIRPDLAVIHFTHLDRSEYLGPDSRWFNDIEHVGGWNTRDPIEQDRPLSPGLRYLRHHAPRAALLETLKDIYLVQCALKSRQIPYVMLWDHARHFFRRPMSNEPALGDFAGLLDRSRICPFSAVTPAIKIDTIGAGDGHPGPATQAKLVARLLDSLPPLHPGTREGRVERAVAGDAVATGEQVLVLGVRACSCTGENHDPACTAAFSQVFGAAYGDGVRRRAMIRDPVLSGASNDALTRRLLIESRKRRPTRVLMAFAAPGPCEHFVRRAFVGSRLIELSLPSGAGGVRSRQARQEQAFDQYVSSELRWLNTLKNMLLAQEHLNVLSTDFLFAMPPAFDFEAGGVLAHKVLKSLACGLDRSRCVANRQQHPPGMQARRPPPTERAGIRVLSNWLLRRKARRRNAKDHDPNVYPLW